MVEDITTALSRISSLFVMRPSQTWGRSCCHAK
jgi:hypothetical protein